MLKPLLVKFLGLCLSPLPLLGLIIQAFKRGWSNVFYVKDRTVAPTCLTGNDSAFLDFNVDGQKYIN